MTRNYLRLDSLDLIRGIAVLAILLVNIWSFGLPFVAYNNPRNVADFSAPQALTWALSYILVHEKFITIFTILFGAGCALFVEHAKDRQQSAWTLHSRRMVALFVIGIIHGYAVWSGDVLAVYAIIGWLLYGFLLLPARYLLIAALLFFSLSVLVTHHASEAMLSAYADHPTRALLYWLPPPETLQQEIEQMRGSWWQQMPLRLAQSRQLESHLIWFYSSRLLAQMLFGVWLFRTRWFHGERPLSHYYVIAIVGLSTGLGLAFASVQQQFDSDFAFDVSLGAAQLLNYFGSMLAAMGYIALFIIWSKSSFLLTWQRQLRLVGRMAFSSYLLTSLLCSWFFYGHGLGYFARLNHLQLLAVVIAVWCVIAVFSRVYIAYSPQGPFEQLWRRLTYGRLGRRERG